MQIVDRDVIWNITEHERGYLFATDGKQVIAERDLASLEAAIKASDPNNPRIDGVAFVDPLPTAIGGVGLK